MYLIFGKNGQLGSAMEALLNKKSIACGAEQCDFLKPALIEEMLEKHEPRAVINAAGYTKVDLAEEEKDEAFAINAHAPGVIAKWCAENDVPMVHFSTDYVYDGAGDAPRTEYASPNPINAYGESKLAGDRAVQDAKGKHLIFRVSWLYSTEGQNFFNTMLRLSHEKEIMQVVNDQFGAPTYVPHLATAVLEGLTAASTMEAFPSGVYHLSHGGEVSWHGFASAIIERAREVDEGIITKDILPIATAEYPTTAARPHNSRLDCSKIKKTLGVTLPSWEQGLKACVKEKYARKRDAA